MIVQTNHDAVVAYVERHLKVKISEPSITLGFVTSDKSRALCAVVLNEYNNSNIEMTICAERGGITIGVMRYLAQYVFGQLGCRRLTVRCKRHNRHARRMAERFGFKYESVAQRFFPDDDATVLRMFKEECPWLRQ